MAVGISLHIGLNEVDPKMYGGKYPLKGCVNDAIAMYNIAGSLGYKQRRTVVNSAATVSVVITEIRRVASILQGGDIFFLTYSGHGSYIYDSENDEDDGRDETWCLYDGMIKDDNLYYLWSLFKPGVRIIVLSDSCHSGTMIKEIPMAMYRSDSVNETKRYLDNNITQNVYDNRKVSYLRLEKKDYDTLECTVKLIAACQDNQVSLDGVKNGLFTEKLLKVWDNGKFTGSYLELYNSILKLMPNDQTPNYITIGQANPTFDSQRAFSV